MNKKGFTLIELLAVIVILSIIIVIAIPKVLDVIEDAQMKSFNESAQLIGRAAQFKSSQNEFDGGVIESTYTFSNGVQTSTDKIEFKGEVPDNGIVKVNQNKKVSYALISKDKKYCATKDYNGQSQVKRATTTCSVGDLSAVVADENLQEYNVTFDSNGGNKISSIKVKYNKEIGLLPTPEKDGDTFKGWYTSLSGGEQISTTTRITSDVTYYAQWNSPYGLYDSSNNQIANWDDLVNNYNLNITKDYSSYSYLTDTSSGRNVFNNSVLSSGVKLIIPNTVTKIGSYALSSVRLTEIMMPNSLTNINSYSFENSTYLTSVTIPKNVSNLSYTAFLGCTNLENINVDTDNNYYSSQNGVVFNKNKTTLIIYPNGKRETAYIIPNSVQNISEYAFKNCSNLINITIPDGVTNIGAAAFSGCSGLTNITIPDSVTSMGNTVFSNCRALTSITIGSHVTSIGTSVFSGCTNLTSIIIPNSVTSIGTNAFTNCSSLKDLTIGDHVRSIGMSAFSNCTSLKNVIIPSSVIEIGLSAFSGCTNLTTVTFNTTENWKYYNSSTATSGTSIGVTNSSTNASNLRDTYSGKVWKRG